MITRQEQKFFYYLAQLSSLLEENKCYVKKALHVYKNPQNDMRLKTSQENRPINWVEVEDDNKTHTPGYYYLENDVTTPIKQECDKEKMLQQRIELIMMIARTNGITAVEASRLVEDVERSYTVTRNGLCDREAEQNLNVRISADVSAINNALRELGDLGK